MVYFIKSDVGFDQNVGKIAKLMINIEQNKNIFNLEGELKNDPTPFNLYTYNGIEYDIKASIGVITIYSNDNIQTQLHINNLIREFQSDDRYNINSSNVPDAVKLSDFKTTNHTILLKYSAPIHGTTSVVMGPSYRKIISNSNDIKKCKENGSKFIWLINGSSGNYHNINIQELSSTIPQKEFLMQSISTIIYDQVNLFNVPSNTKQLDYPYIHQYSIFDQKRLIDSTVIISDAFGLAYEIINCYDIGIKIKKKHFLHHNPTLKFVDYNNIKLKRVDVSKVWHTHINEKFDFESQEKLEDQSDEIGKPPFPIDICFITRVPLYKHAYVIKVGLEEKTPETYSNITHILVSPSIYSSSIPDTKVVPNCITNFRNYFTDKTKYTILDTYITKFNRTELDAIDLIPRDRISDQRRNLLRCISLNGCYFANEHYPKTLITVDKEKKIMYAGFKDMYDRRVLSYINTNTVLFTFDGL